jgi:hypothetical protein
MIAKIVPKIPYFFNTTVFIREIWLVERLVNKWKTLQFRLHGNTPMQAIVIAQLSR